MHALPYSKQLRGHHKVADKTSLPLELPKLRTKCPYAMTQTIWKCSPGEVIKSNLKVTKWKYKNFSVKLTCFESVIERCTKCKACKEILTVPIMLVWSKSLNFPPKLELKSCNDGMVGKSERHSYDQENNTLSETRKCFEHLLLSLGGHLPKIWRNEYKNKIG